MSGVVDRNKRKHLLHFKNLKNDNDKGKYFFRKIIMVFYWNYVKKKIFLKKKIVFEIISVLW